METVVEKLFDRVKLVKNWILIHIILIITMYNNRIVNLRFI